MSTTKILYIEDEPFLGKIVKESLESRGFEVIMESDGDKVIALMQRTNPDICVTDVMLPNKDGFSIAEEIRKINKQIPIIFLTAKTQTQDVVKGFNLGANDYIRKPFSMEELIVRVEHQLNKGYPETRQTEPAAIAMGRYVFRPAKQLLTDQGQVRKLSYRESQLLQLLYQGREGVVLRGAILNALWGSESFFNSRNLDVYITKLRAYLKNDPSLEIITVKGVGYRFVI